MIDSASSSISRSQSEMCSSTWATMSAGTWSVSIAFASRSNTLIAAHRLVAFSTVPCRDSSMCASACSTDPEKTCGLSPFTPSAAARIANSAAARVFSPSRAEISITGHPSFFASFAASSLSPFLRTTSIMFTATTIGSPNSSSCVVRKRLRSRFEPSTMFRMASGFSLTR